MSELQQRAIHLIRELSDEDVSFLINIIERLMPQKAYMMNVHPVEESMEMQAFKRLDAARLNMKHYFPDDFDPEKELEEIRNERYGSID